MFKFRHRRHILVECFVGFLLCYQTFFLWVLLFSLKPTFLNSNSTRNGRRTTALWICYLLNVIYIIIITPLPPPCSDGLRRVTTKHKVKTTCQVDKTIYKTDIKSFFTPIPLHSSTNWQDAPLDTFQFFNLYPK